jgi:hypothetical protein
MRLNGRFRKKLNYNTSEKMYLAKFDNNVALASQIFKSLAAKY